MTYNGDNYINLAIVNAKLWTGNPKQNHNANAIGIKDSKIVIISDKATVLQLCNKSTRIIDAQNGLVVPGFTDSHCHFLDAGLRLLSIQLRHVATKELFTKKVAEEARKLSPGTWILGGDWDHYNWGGILPDKSWIDHVTSDHPVWLNRMDGHMCLANSYALKLAGITKTTQNVQGGEIIRDVHGEVTGIFKDNAQNLVTPFIPKHTINQSLEAVEAATNYVSKRGVTEVHTMVTVDCACGLWPKNFGIDAENEDMKVAYEELSIYRCVHQTSKLKTRIRAALPLASWRRLQREIELYGSGDDWLRVGYLKAMIDGSLGSHTAAFRDDYSDKPGYRGHLIWDPAILERHIFDASDAGFQVMVHAIGDYAIHEQLNIFERVKQNLSNADLRFRVEHAQHISKEDISRFGKLNIIPSMQMSHLADDGRWAEEAIGQERMKTSWPMKSLLAGGATVALGSDWFVTEPSPLEGIYAAVSRNTIDGKNPQGLIPEERVSVEDALRGYTSGAAYSIFEEHKRGTIETGKLADIVILDKDITKIPINDIPQTKILVTIVDGHVVHSVI